MIDSPQSGRDPASYRDPSGFVFHQGEKIFRYINQQGVDDFQFFISSGLADRLKTEKLIADFSVVDDSGDTMTIEAEKIPFITYPYEWSFSQLRDAALATLKINRIALDHGMILKDASAFNIAFHRQRPLFIDHTSFTRYQENAPWAAYKQFCTNFLAPLYLMKYVDLRCLDLLKSDINGIPLDFASHLLPWYTKLVPQTLLNIHLHSKSDLRYSGNKKYTGQANIPLQRLKRFIDGVLAQVEALSAPEPRTLWKEYYLNTNYSEKSFEYKKQAVEEFCFRQNSQVTLDLGANTGVFSAIAAKYSGMVLAADVDPMAVEELYISGKKSLPNLVPVRLDLFNPTASYGLFNRERSSFFSRCGKTDCCMGLALIHHLRVSGNWQIPDIARLFADTGRRALVEFVPLEDEQMRQLVRKRDVIYRDWTIDNVIDSFQKEFALIKTTKLPDSQRVLLEFAIKE